MTTLDGPFDHELEFRWRNVKARLSAVLRNMQDNPVKTFPEEWNDIYTDVAKLYSQNDTVKMRRMYGHVRQYIRDLVDVQLHHLRLLDGTILLSEYVRRWKATMKYVRFMKRVLHHLQQFWIPENANTLKHDPVRPLDKLLMFYWREDLLSNLPSVVDIALDLVDEDRRGNHANRDVVRGIVDNFVEIGAADVCDESFSKDSIYGLENHFSSHFSTLHLYVQVFEGRFLSRTRKFYKEEGVRIARDGNIKFFVEQIRNRLTDEEERVRVLLHKDSALRVREAAEAELIGNHKEYLQSEANKMIREGRDSELQVIFKLLERVEDGLIPIRNFFINFVRDEGNAIVVKHADELNGNLSITENLILVERLLSLYLKHANMSDRCVNGSNMIMVAIENAFRGFVNRSLGPICIPNLLAYYVDRLLRSNILEGFHIADEHDDCEEDTEGASSKNGTGTTLQFCKLHGLAASLSDNSLVSEELLRDRLLNELVRFFGYLDDKDMFFETHRILFAKRLLYGSNGTLESAFISKLKLKAGNSYTQRLTGMFQDIESAKPFRERFASYVEALRLHCLQQSQPHTRFGTLMRKIEKANPRSLSEIKEILYEESDKIGSMLGISMPSLHQIWFTTNSSGSITHAPRQSQVNHAVQRVRQSNPRLQKPFNPLETSDVPWRPGMSGTRFRPDKSVSDALNIDFNGHVLNALHWPSEKKLDLNLPGVLKTCQELFSDFYMRGKKPRKLTWIHSASVVHLRARLKFCEYTLVLSTVQACFLLLLNEKARISVKDAARQLNISPEELLEHLDPLFCGKETSAIIFLS
ncbi:Cullin-2 [Gracilariopsis chorda]|uniref:Cullin-2 n=1 Tax=Gracilariopsis chorda TaxID=448386 RepID=A0A2V3IX78_9FLOR|nr:Cullin-2 [Gracilariopsis chorda]|eukprot:PXF46764.1 Cullin-2 [Gracilariopsis chorda]